MLSVDFVLVHAFGLGDNPKSGKINENDWGHLSSKISGKKIYKEEAGKNTYDCTINSFKKIIIPNGWKSGIITSNAEHLPRIILQTTKIIKKIQLKCNIRLFYSGPSVDSSGDSEKAIKEFKEHEIEGIKHTLNRED